MFCEIENKECKAIFCRNKCIHKKEPMDIKIQNQQAHKNKIIHSQSAEEGLDCYVHNCICHSVLCEQNGCRALINKNSLPVRMNKKEKTKRWKHQPTMKEKTSEEMPEKVFAERLKRSGACQKCGHYKPCLKRCYNHVT